MLTKNDVYKNVNDKLSNENSELEILSTKFSCLLSNYKPSKLK